MWNSKLLPCPFCGGEHIDLYEGNYGNGVYCMSCGVMMGEPIHLEFRVSERVGMAQAIAAWNTRAETKAERDLRELVKDMWANQEALPYGLYIEIRDRMRELGVVS